MRIVIVDDEPDIRLLLEVQLQLEGFDVVTTAADGAEGVSACLEHRPDAVVMDLLMPVMTGFEAIGILRKEMPALGIVAYTGVAGDYVRQQMATLGISLALKSGDVKPLAETLRNLDASASRTPS